MKKKVVSVLLCVAMTATMLLGCSAGSEKSDSKKSSKSESGGTTEMKVDGDATTINVWTFIELHQKFYTEMAKKWNEEHPDKKVKLVLSNMQYDDMHNKLSLALESGKGAPDVVDIELGKFPSFTNGKIGLMDLTDAIAPYKDNIVESRLDIYGKDGKYYGFPTHVGTTVAFYNDDLLKEAGIDYTTIKTWDDFKAAGVKYHEKTGKNFACAETTAQWMVNLMLAQKGTDYIDKDGNLDLTNDKVVEVLQYIKDMQDAGALATVAGDSRITKKLIQNTTVVTSQYRSCLSGRHQDLQTTCLTLKERLQSQLLRYLETTMQLRQSVVVEPVQQL